ncbi:MAG TPA: DUF5666 domain-containing protein [Ktedonobacteraceae bacterium]|nr:DUF5666 domain-containing protein [Ktedonobacteraceae bacterium]
MSLFPIFGKISPGKTVMSFLFLPLAMLLLASCGSNASTAGASTSSSTSAAATATACAQPRSSFKAATGTLSSLNGSTFVVATLKGSNVTVSYSSTTRFTREDNVPATSLKEGTFVTVAVTSTGSTYTATRITVTAATGTGNGTGFGNGRFPGASRTPGAGRGANPCFNRGQFATPGTGQPGAGGTGTANFRGLVGTVSQVTATTMIVTDTSGSTFSVTITPQTQVMETTNVTSAALKTGQALTVMGTPGSNGAIDARSVIILLKLPAPGQTQS